jgi:hypothetical protein
MNYTTFDGLSRHGACQQNDAKMPGHFLTAKATAQARAFHLQSPPQRKKPPAASLETPNVREYGPSLSATSQASLRRRKAVEFIII